MSIKEQIRQDETWLSVDGVVGCKMNCQYCFLQLYNATPHPGEQIASTKELIKNLQNYPTYRPESVVMLGSETDFFMHQRNIAYLKQVLLEMQRQDLPNKVALVTKNHVPQEFLDWCKIECPERKIFFYFSYSGLTAPIEPVTNIEQLRANFPRVREAGFDVIHYWRPFLPQNSKPEIIKSIADHVIKYSSCSVVLGLKVNPQIQQNMAKIWPELGEVDINWDTVGQVYPKGVKQALYSYISPLNCLR